MRKLKLCSKCAYAQSGMSKLSLFYFKFDMVDMQNTFIDIKYILRQ